MLLCVTFAVSFGGCRTKCEEGSKTYPDCLNIEATPTPEYRELVVWNLSDPSAVFVGPMQQFESTQNAINPGLKVTYKQFSNPAEYEALVIGEIAQGKGPDVFAVDPTWLTKYPGIFVPMPADLMVPGQVDELFFPVVAKTLVRSDYILALPMYIDTLALYYNAKIFRNQLYKSNKPNETWEAVKEQAFDMSEQDKSIERFRLSTIAMGRADNIRLAADIVSMLFLQYGAELFDAEGAKAIVAQAQGTTGGTGKPNFPGIEAMKMYTGFADSRYKNFSWNRLITGLYPQLDEIGAFARGKVAMIFGYSSTYSDVLATIEGLNKNNAGAIIPTDIDTAPAPQLNGFSSDNRVALAHFYPLAVAAGSKHAYEAWQFVRYVTTDEEIARSYHKETKKPSALKSLNPEQSSEALFGVFARQVPYAQLLDVISTRDFESFLKQATSELEIKDLETQVMPTLELRLQCLLDKTKGEKLDTDCSKIQ